MIGRVDRTELSKNVYRGLLAYRELLRTRPEWRGQVVHAVFDYPSREDLPEYRAYVGLIERLGEDIDDEFGTDTTDPELWRVYTEALDRLYADVPALSGVLIRVGEGGSIYAEPGWDYYSALEVTTVEAVRTRKPTGPKHSCV